MWETLYDYRVDTNNHDGWGMLVAAVVMVVFSFLLVTPWNIKRNQRFHPTLSLTSLYLVAWGMRGFAVFIAIFGVRFLVQHDEHVTQLETQAYLVVEGPVQKIVLLENRGRQTIRSLEVNGVAFFLPASRIGSKLTSLPHSGGVFREGDHIRICYDGYTILRVERRQ